MKQSTTLIALCHIYLVTMFTLQYLEDSNEHDTVATAAATPY